MYLNIFGYVLYTYISLHSYLNSGIGLLAKAVFTNDWKLLLSYSILTIQWQRYTTSSTLS